MYLFLYDELFLTKNDNVKFEIQVKYNLQVYQEQYESKSTFSGNIWCISLTLRFFKINYFILLTFIGWI
jgi:hypothetical protein